MRICLPILFLVIFGCAAFASPKTDSLLTELKRELTRKKIYDDQKEVHIKQLKVSLSTVPSANYNLRYRLCSNIYEEYKVYQFDSAYVYINKMQNISNILQDAPKQSDCKLKLGFILLSAGMFKEAFDCFNGIDVHLLNNDLKIQYYSLRARAHSDLADYDNNIYYSQYNNELSITYLDSTIALCKPNSYDYLMQQGNKQVRLGDLKKPSEYYTRLLNSYPLTTHQRAMVATGLSAFYKEPSQIGERTDLLIIGVINDIRSSTKETLASFELGDLLYRNGNIKDAYIFINQAMDDAEYYGARLRKIKIGAVLPVVAAEKLVLMEKEKNKFLVYLLSIAAVSILVLMIFFIIFNQLKRLKVKEKIIEEKNQQLESINDKLIEDTHIKEEYIGYFFNVISGYILKLEKLKRNIDRKLAAKKYEDIQLTVNEINIKKERDLLFYTFDHIFLKIFPNFITVFNSLFRPEDQIWPKDHEVLNTDLRIFALIRMGINDNETIANILEYSVNTIYVYKMRIKARSILPGDQFDEKIMSIKAVEVLNKS
jgi:tetratricopeptide (TPR) repeat protein